MEQTKDTQEILAGQTATRQQDKSLNDQDEGSSLPSIVDSKENEEAQHEKNPFWLSWYSAGMLLSLGFFFYCFPRLTGFPSEAFLVTDGIAAIIDCIGLLLALILLFMTFEKVMRNIITLCILLLVPSIIIIIVMRLAIRHSMFPEVIAIFLLSFQILALLVGVLIIYLGFYGLYQAKPTKESINAFLQMINAKNVFTFLLAVLGAITVIVSFIQLVLSLITGKH